jgi:prepilin-type N-terminal cleavage/methylation domain-containing protein
MPRRAVTLIEMLVVIAVSTVLMGVAIGLLPLLRQAENSGRDHIDRTAAASRLADQFRRDIHAALRPVANEGGPKNQWHFALGADRTVAYRVLPGEVERVEQLAGKPVRRESYTLPPDCTVKIVLPGGAAPAMATLSVASSGPSSQAGCEMRVEALLGMDHRFVKPSEGGK